MDLERSGITRTYGPLEKNQDEAARSPGAIQNWRPFATDARGAVLTGLVTDYAGSRSVAYFCTRFEHDQDEELYLQISTADDLAMWMNGRFYWFIQREDYAWFDFSRNSKHAGQKIPIPVRKGENQIVFRARGGVYATGGFFARITSDPPAAK
jgi:hypothetical protein